MEDQNVTRIHIDQGPSRVRVPQDVIEPDPGRSLQDLAHRQGDVEVVVIAQDVMLAGQEDDEAPATVAIVATMTGVGAEVGVVEEEVIDNRMDWI